MYEKNSKEVYIYPAIFSFGSGGYTVTFPNLPGCITQGADVREALAMAKEAMELYIFCLEEDNPKNPAAVRPSRKAQIAAALIHQHDRDLDAEGQRGYEARGKK